MCRLFERNFDVLEPSGAKKLRGATIDEASNMTGSHRGTVTCIERACFPGFSRAWGGLHQLDYVVQSAVSLCMRKSFAPHSPPPSDVCANM
jgi:hypothetical protein